MSLRKMNITTISPNPTTGNLQDAGMIVGISVGVIIIAVIISMSISYYYVKKREAANELILPVYASMLNNHRTRSILSLTQPPTK